MVAKDQNEKLRRKLAALEDSENVEDVNIEDRSEEKSLGMVPAPNKTPTQKLSKRRRQENESNVQWIGDKVG